MGHFYIHPLNLQSMLKAAVIHFKVSRANYYFIDVADTASILELRRFEYPSRFVKCLTKD